MKKSVISMNHLALGEHAIVSKLLAEGSIRRRLQDIGLIEGTKIECMEKSPLGDPVAYSIRGAVIALRADDAKHVEVLPWD